MFSELLAQRETTNTKRQDNAANQRHPQQARQERPPSGILFSAMLHEHRTDPIEVPPLAAADAYLDLS